MQTTTSSLRRLAIACLLLAGCAAPDLPQDISPEQLPVHGGPAPEILLGPGDLLQVVLPGQPELTQEQGYRISARGSLVLPLCGPVQVAGFGLERAEEEINRALAEFIKSPAVGLSVIERGAQRIYLLGQVKSPGVVVLDRPLTALEALAHTGGFEFGARREHVAIIRRHADGGCSVAFFDAETPGAASQQWVMPGDVLFVPRSGVGVFRDEVLPILQGIGFATSQLTAVALAADTF